MADGNAKFYADFDRAVAQLPREIKADANLGRADSNADGSMTFFDDRGREMATVNSDGHVVVGSRKPAKPAPETATKDFVMSELDRMAVSVVKGLGIVIGEELVAINETVRALKAEVKSMGT
jgi:hypothetical protein